MDIFFLLSTINGKDVFPAVKKTLGKRLELRMLFNISSGRQGRTKKTTTKPRTTNHKQIKLGRRNSGRVSDKIYKI